MTRRCNINFNVILSFWKYYPKNNLLFKVYCYLKNWNSWKISSLLNIALKCLSCIVMYIVMNVILWSLETMKSSKLFSLHISCENVPSHKNSSVAIVITYVINFFSPSTEQWCLILMFLISPFFSSGIALFSFFSILWMHFHLYSSVSSNHWGVHLLLCHNFLLSFC